MLNHKAALVLLGILLTQAAFAEEVADVMQVQAQVFSACSVTTIPPAAPDESDETSGAISVSSLRASASVVCPEGSSYKIQVTELSALSPALTKDGRIGRCQNGFEQLLECREMSFPAVQVYF